MCTEHGRYGLFGLYAETVECISSAGSVWYVGVSVMSSRILLLLNMADMDPCMEDCGVSNAEYHVHYPWKHFAKPDMAHGGL